MKSVLKFAGASLLFLTIASVPAQRSGAQDFLLQTEPLTVHMVTQNGNTVVTQPESSVLHTRVTVNINNENVRDALKKVIGKTGLTYEVDSDVPETTKVTLKADNILLLTAINAIIESAGIGCTQNVNREVTNSNGKQTATTQIHLRFSKMPTAPLGEGPISWLVNIPANAFETNRWSDSMLKAMGALHSNIGDGKIMLKNQITIPDGAADSTGKLRNFLAVLGDGSKPYVYNLTTSEERATFTCPHCHEQVTIIKKHVAPKCPTCGRTFQDDWKFCPVDGTKRPEDSGSWKFCPHCGKPVSWEEVNFLRSHIYRAETQPLRDQPVLWYLPVFCPRQHLAAVGA